MINPYEKRILRVLDHIHSHPAGDLSLDALADVAAMSRFHWHRTYHAMTGETCAETVRRVRMHRAAHWLVLTDWPVAEVAARAGYANLRSFSRAFREVNRLTPVAFRRKGELTSPFHPKPPGDRPMYPIEIAATPARRLFAVPHKGAYFEISRAFERLGAVFASRNLWAEARGMVGVYYDDPHSIAVADLRSHAGVVVGEAVPLPDGLEEVLLPAGRAAVLHFRGHYSGLPAAYDYLYGVWLPASGQETRDTPPFEEYLNSPMDTAPDDLLTDIVVPLA